MPCQHEQVSHVWQTDWMKILISTITQKARFAFVYIWILKRLVPQQNLLNAENLVNGNKVFRSQQSTFCYPTDSVSIFFIICRSGVKSAIFLLPLLGLTWIFGLLAVNKDTVIFQYIFAFLNSLQVNNTCWEWSLCN